MTLLGGRSQVLWEYQGITRASDDALIAALNEAGKEGWELVSASPSRDLKGIMCWTAVLKRPVGGAAGASPGIEAGAARSVPSGAATAASSAGVSAFSEEETDFDLNLPKPAARSSAPEPKPAKAPPVKPRMAFSDDFDFELAATMPAAPQPTSQTKSRPKLAGLDDDFDFEVGSGFTPAVQAPAQAPKASKSAEDDGTDFDVG